MGDIFRTKAAYLGGHPSVSRAGSGLLSLDSGHLRWVATPKGLDSTWRKLRRQADESFDIEIVSIISAEFKGDAELKKAPSGYLTAIPGVALGFGGSQAKHPLGTGRLKKLLIVRFADTTELEYDVVFANEPADFGFGLIGPMAQNSNDRGGYELVSKIMAARAAAVEMPQGMPGKA